MTPFESGHTVRTRQIFLARIIPPQQVLYIDKTQIIRITFRQVQPSAVSGNPHSSKSVLRYLINSIAIQSAILPLLIMLETVFPSPIRHADKKTVLTCTHPQIAFIILEESINIFTELDRMVFHQFSVRTQISAINPLFIIDLHHIAFISYPEPFRTVNIQSPHHASVKRMDIIKIPI